jgi:hypothetical protein
MTSCRVFVTAFLRKLYHKTFGKSTPKETGEKHRFLVIFMKRAGKMVTIIPECGK